MIERYVLDLQDVDEMQAAVVGGKGAHLGGLSWIEGIRVPAGFCVTTDALRRIMAEAPSFDDRLDPLSRLRALPDGEQKADETKRMIDRVRTFIGYREYPKYVIVSRRRDPTPTRPEPTTTSTAPNNRISTHPPQTRHSVSAYRQQSTNTHTTHSIP